MYQAPLSTVIGLVFFCQSLLAQENTMMATISSQLEELVDSYVKESLLKHRFPQDVNDLIYIFGPKQVDSLQFQNELSEKKAEMNLIRRDNGLKLQSSYSNNFAGSVLEDDGTFYQWRTSTGVDWDLLKGGLLSQKQILAQKQLEFEAASAVEHQRLKELSYRKSFDLIIYIFNQEKVQVIRKRLDILTGLLAVLEKMYYLRYNHWEDVLDAMSKKTETQLFLDNYLTYLESVRLDSTLKTYEIRTLPVFDLIFDEIERRGGDTLTQSLLLAKNLQALDHQHHWSKEISLNAQLRYNYYNGGVAATYGARDFMTGGVTFSIPIPFNQGARKDWKEAKKEKFKTEFDSYRMGLNNELLTHYYEYEYTHKKYVEFFYKKEQLAVTINRSLRKRNLSDPDYSPMAVVDKLDELFSVDLELIDIQQQMYLKALKIFAMIDAPDILPYIDVKDYNLAVNQFSASRNLSCNAEDLMEYDSYFLVEFFKQNGIKEISVEATASPDAYLKYAALLDAAVGSDLKIRFTVDPYIVSSPFVTDLNTSVNLSLTPFLHFNLLTSFVDNPESQIGLVNILTTFSKSFDIQISVPANTDRDILGSLLPFVSRIYLVPDHSQDLAGMYYDLAPDQTGLPDAKICPVVLPQDFGTKLEMDHFIEQLVDHLQINMIGIASMSDLIGLDKKTVGWHEERRF